MREAVRRLKHSTLGRGTNLGSLPLVFVLGDPGSTKTTVLHSFRARSRTAGGAGLSGQRSVAHLDREYLVYATGNFCGSRGLDDGPGGSLETTGQAAAAGAIFGSNRQTSASARERRSCASTAKLSCSRERAKPPSRPREDCRCGCRKFPSCWGSVFRFTFCSRSWTGISFFTDFVRGMSKDEASEVLGATLPLRSLSAGVYADEETKRRLTKAFDEIFYSLAERRIVLLPREHESDKLPGIYEFPRELRKLRTSAGAVSGGPGASQPSGHESFSARLLFYRRAAGGGGRRGCGAGGSGGSGGSRIRCAAQRRFFAAWARKCKAAPVAMRSGGSRRVPQWVFLTSLFNDVLVKDRVALATSGSSSRVNLLRRIALGAAVLVGADLPDGFRGFVFAQPRAGNARAGGGRRLAAPCRRRSNQVASLGDLQKAR